MIEQIVDVIKSSGRVLILPHINPDGDCLGSAYALKGLLKGMGKQADVLLEPGEASPRELPILLETEEESPFKPDLVIAVDCGDRDRLGKRISRFDACSQTVNIDHHPTNPGFAKLNYVDSHAAATGELIFELAKALGAAVTKEVASNLYVAIASDSGGFAYSNTTPRTHLIAAELIKTGIAHDKLSAFLFERNSLAQLKLMGLVLQTLETYEDGAIAAVSVTQKILKEAGAKESECGGLISLPRSLDTAKIAFCFKETEKGLRVSIRSTEAADVSKLAQKFGGGHARASGCTLPMSLEEGKRLMILEAKKLLEQEAHC
jgi:phosphoesterase RecJ-like protein